LKFSEMKVLHEIGLQYLKISSLGRKDPDIPHRAGIKNMTAITLINK